MKQIDRAVQLLRMGIHKDKLKFSKKIIKQAITKLNSSESRRKL